MTGYHSLSQPEIEYLCEMFNTVKFAGIHLSKKMDNVRLKALKDQILRTCLIGLYEKNIESEQKEIISNILSKNGVTL
jgi:hypothetical protein